MRDIKLKNVLSTNLVEIQRHGSFGIHLTLCLNPNIYEVFHEKDVVYFVEIHLTEDEKENICESNVVEFLEDAGLWDKVEDYFYNSFINIFQENGVISQEVFEHSLKLN